ncbi:uncharacterized protein [Nicotiana tomentosiformis]|uniref:uncharacterized protein n=1 Tax=Nicotiana tomentosiformis TaxID=4098 RepID=UPI00388C645B
MDRNHLHHRLDPFQAFARETAALSPLHCLHVPLIHMLRMMIQRFKPSKQTTKIITNAIKKLYDGPYATWTNFPYSLKEQIFNQFKSKCVWEDCYSEEVAANFHHKARKRLADHFLDGRKKKKRHDWCLQHLWDDLLRQWQTENFLRRSEKEKKARSSKKRGSLHTRGAIYIGTIKRRLENKYGRPMSQDELFKETHILKKKKEGDGDRWVEERVETAYGRYQSNMEEFIRSQLAGELGEPTQPSDEDAERIW